MTHRGPFQPLLFCVILRDLLILWLSQRKVSELGRYEVEYLILVVPLAAFKVPIAARVAASQYVRY